MVANSSIRSLSVGYDFARLPPRLQRRQDDSTANRATGTRLTTEVLPAGGGGAGLPGGGLGYRAAAELPAAQGRMGLDVGIGAEIAPSDQGTSLADAEVLADSNAQLSLDPAELPADDGASASGSVAVAVDAGAGGAATGVITSSSGSAGTVTPALPAGGMTFAYGLQVAGGPEARGSLALGAEYVTDRVDFAYNVTAGGNGSLILEATLRIGALLQRVEVPGVPATGNLSFAYTLTFAETGRVLGSSFSVPFVLPLAPESGTSGAVHSTAIQLRVDQAAGNITALVLPGAGGGPLPQLTASPVVLTQVPAKLRISPGAGGSSRGPAATAGPRATGNAGGSRADAGGTSNALIIGLAVGVGVIALGTGVAAAVYVSRGMARREAARKDVADEPPVTFSRRDLAAGRGLPYQERRSPLYVPRRLGDDDDVRGAGRGRRGNGSSGDL